MKEYIYLVFICISGTRESLFLLLILLLPAQKLKTEGEAEKGEKKDVLFSGHVEMPGLI